VGLRGLRGLPVVYQYFKSHCLLGLADVAIYFK
jgi:hypothetical protein